MPETQSQTLPDETSDIPVTDAGSPEGEEVAPGAEAQAEIEKWKDLALRTAAELDNFRKRTARDMQDARAFANADLLRSLIPILDNFEMGLEAARAENEKGMIYQGLSMVRRQLADFLKDQGVDEVNAMLQPFDPNLHEATSQEPDGKVPEGSVIRVLRRGFRLKDRLLRPAMVVVSSGKLKAETASAS